VAAAPGDDRGEPRGQRADARRNRDKIVTAARELFMTEGPDAPLDDVARLAGIGKGTLYRNFPDRDTLLGTIAYDTFRQLAGLASAIRESEDDAWIALCRYLREWSALRLGVLYDALCDRLPAMIKADPELQAARAQWLGILEQMVSAAQAAGRLRPDVRAGDIALFMNILQQRKTGHDLLAQSSERFLELMLDGLSARRDVPLPGEPLTTKALDR
jgi:AcrR family transcriptional regulator